MEGTLIKNSGAPDEHQRRVAAEALTLWRYYWVENVFDLELPDWELGLRHALQLQRQVGRQIAGATACVHVGLARVSGATHFLSFEPKSREAAQLFGLEVLPERL
ncbi:MAG: hypothetical protein HYY24_21180 [Verrucomicrobia bacterium]|nr:hypothetical protein [Verrucomicrobiota bacterium]